MSKVSELRLYLSVDCKNVINAPLYEVIHDNKDIKLMVFKFFYSQGYNPLLSVGFSKPYLDKNEWKRPYCAGWSKYAEERLPKEEFEKQCELLQKNPYYNIGLVTKYNGLVVYDIDSFEYADAVEEAYIKTFGASPINDTYIEKSKRGFKIYFRVKDLPKNASTVKIKTSPELARYCGLYVVCFPSIHTDSVDDNVIVYLPVKPIEEIVKKYKGKSFEEVLPHIINIKEITYDELLTFEENLKEILGIESNTIDYEFKDIEFTPIGDRVDISGDIIEDTAKMLANVVKPLWVEGQRWAIVLSLSYFFARLTKVNPTDASKIIYTMAKLLGTDEKRAKELSKKVYNAYKRVSKGLTIAYKTFLRECGLPEDKINEFKNAVIKAFITSLKDLCNIRYSTAKFFAEIPIVIKEENNNVENKDNEVEEKEIGKILMEKYNTNKYLLTFVNNEGIEVGKRLVTVKQLYDDRTYTPMLKRLGVSSDYAPILAIDLINKVISKHNEFVKRMKSLAASEVYAKLEELNAELKEYGLCEITQDDIDTLFEYDSDNDRITLSFTNFGELLIRIFNSLVSIETGEIFIYLNGIYKNNEVSEFTIEYVIRKLADIIASTLCKDEAKEMITTRFINEVLSYVKDMSKRVSYSDFNDYSRYIPLQNGVYDLEEETLLPHDPKYLFTFKLPIEYDPNAECPNIERFINSIVKPHDVDLLWKIVAYTLIPGQPHQCWFILVGRGANGKSTYLRLIEEFLGSENVSHVPLQTLEKEKFSRVQIVGKLANIYADLPRDALKTSGFIKAFTGEDALYIEPKYKKGFSYKPNSKLIFSANELPEIHDESEGFWRRVVLIEFPYTFKRDPKLFSRISTKEELSGLFNKVVKYIKKLKEEGFPSSTEIKEMWLRKSSPLIAFVREHIVEDEGGMVRKDELYNIYKAFCKKYNIHNKYLIKGGYELFFRDIKDLLDRLGVRYEEQKLSFEDGRKRVLVNISLTNLDALKDELEEDKDNNNRHNENDNSNNGKHDKGNGVDNTNNNNNDVNYKQTNESPNKGQEPNDKTNYDKEGKNNSHKYKYYEYDESKDRYDIVVTLDDDIDDEITPLDKKILEIMDKQPTKLFTPLELAELLDAPEDEVEKSLVKLFMMGEVLEPRRGQYSRMI